MSFGDWKKKKRHGDTMSLGHDGSARRRQGYVGHASFALAVVGLGIAGRGRDLSRLCTWLDF
jgi:hypothetical protein